VIWGVLSKRYWRWVRAGERWGVDWSIGMQMLVWHWLWVYERVSLDAFVVRHGNFRLSSFRRSFRASQDLLIPFHAQFGKPNTHTATPSANPQAT
jgi:hypothetical protein